MFRLLFFSSTTFDILLPVCFHMWNMNCVTRCGRQTLSNQGCFAPTLFHFRWTIQTAALTGQTMQSFKMICEKYLRNPQFNIFRVVLFGDGRYPWMDGYHTTYLKRMLLHTAFIHIVCYTRMYWHFLLVFFLCNRMQNLNQDWNSKFMEFSHRHFRKWCRFLFELSLAYLTRKWMLASIKTSI